MHSAKIADDVLVILLWAPSFYVQELQPRQSPSIPPYSESISKSSPEALKPLTQIRHGEVGYQL